MNENYFTFPLSILNGPRRDPYSNNNCIGSSPLECINLALYCGIVGAGKGFKHRYGIEVFKERWEEVCDELELGKSSRPGPHTPGAEVLVGAAICNVKLGGHDPSNLTQIVNHAESVTLVGPLVRMKGSYFWAAHSQARAEVSPEETWPEKGISWREFRILCAILSARTNRAKFAFIGWETIQARSCGFTRKEDYKNAKVIPSHLAPPLSHKQIRTTCDDLEALGFYARFRFSSGSRGGLMAYSFRHDRDALAFAVCDHVNFQDRVSVRQNREEDTIKCLQLLERAKLGQSQNKEEGNGKGKGRGKHNKKSTGEKSSDEKFKSELPPNPQGGEFESILKSAKEAS